MSWETIVELSIMWWNTGLVPPKGVSRFNPVTIEFVISELNTLYEISNFQILGLCEVDEECVQAIVDGLKNPYLGYHFKGPVSSYSVANVAVIYDRRFVDVLGESTWTEQHGRTKTMKVGEQVSFLVLLTNEILHLVVSHWPSLRTIPEDDPDRTELANSCRRRINDLSKEHGEDSYIILMGDYNAEPFSTPMAKHLLAVRDRSLVLKYDGYLYNPFWRMIGETLPHVPDMETVSSGGTCYHPANKYRTWALFDQIIFSRSFLKSNNMVLDESKTKIIFTDKLDQAIRSSSEIFDHFPVACTILLRKNK